MLLHFIAVPVAQGFWTLVVAWCGFPEAGAVVFWASLAFASPRGYPGSTPSRFDIGSLSAYTGCAQ